MVYRQKMTPSHQNFRFSLKMPHFRKCPNKVNHVFGHISAKYYPTVCFLSLHMQFCHPEHFSLYGLQPKNYSFTSKF